MQESEPITVKLPVLVDGNNRGEEVLPVEQLGPNRYKLVYSPGFVDGLAAGDEFELLSDDPTGYNVLQRSGNLCVWFIFNNIEELQGYEPQKLRGAVEAIGGWLDGGHSRMLIFTIPVSVGFPLVEKVFNEAKKRNASSEWMFGNVYDPKDQERLLNWWK